MEKEIKRLIDLLHETNPLSKDYSLYLEQLREIYSIYYCFTQDSKPLTVQPETKTVTETVVEPTPVAKPVQETVVAKQEPVVTATVETKGDYTKEEVREMLSNASKNGIQIQPIIAKYVPDGKPVKFSEVPQSKYPELVEEINNAG